MKKIYINGVLIAKSGIHFTKGFTLHPGKILDPDFEIIEGDFEATEQNLLKPWAEYYMSGDCVIAGPADYCCLLPPQEIFKMAIEDLEDINALLNAYPSDAPGVQTLYRQCISNCVGVLEFYLSNTLSSLVLGDESRFKRYVEVEKPSHKLSTSDIDHPFCNYYRDVVNSIEKLNYHELDKIRSIYTKVLSASFPEYKEIEGMITNRHNYVHRNGHKKYLELGLKKELEKQDVERGINITRVFIEELYKNLSINIHESFE